PVSAQPKILSGQRPAETGALTTHAGAGAVRKFQSSRLLAAALAQLVSRQGDAVGLVTYADAIRQFLPSRGGQAHLRALLLALERAPPSGGPDAAAAPGRTDRRPERPGPRGLPSD